MSEPEISIVFANWNTRDYLRECLHSVMEKTIGLTYEFIVVDDGSTDGSVEMLRAEFPQVRVLVNEKNMGVAKTYNRGVALARGKYVQLLNTDMILINNAIGVLRDFLETHGGVGACAGWLRNSDMTSQVSFGDFPSFHQAIIDALFLNDIFPHSNLPNRGKHPEEGMTNPIEVDYVTGASMLIRKDLVDRFGFFDERYTSYCEETDLCYRLKHIAKQKVCFVPGAQIVHYGGGSFGKLRQYQLKLHFSSYDKFLRKHHGALYSLCTRVLYAWPYLIKLVVRFIRYLIAPVGRKGEMKAHALNAWYAIRYSLFPSETFVNQ